MNATIPADTLSIRARLERVSPAGEYTHAVVLHRSNRIPQGADAKRMLFYRWLVDAGRVSDDNGC